MNSRLALYTTIYPGVERFLSTWYASVFAQTDHDFDLHIGTDRIEPREVFSAVGNEFEAVWVAAPTCSTPAFVRQAGIDCILASGNRYHGVVFVDCDDVLHATRVESARMQLQHCEIAGCAMEIVKDDQPTGLLFGQAASVAIPESLATVNVFGMSNTAYRTDALGDFTVAATLSSDGLVHGHCWLDPRCSLQLRQHSSNDVPAVWEQYRANTASIYARIHSPSHGPRSRPLQSYPVAHAYNV
jgi:hypothetical protein